MKNATGKSPPPTQTDYARLLESHTLLLYTAKMAINYVEYPLVLARLKAAIAKAEKLDHGVSP